MRQLDALLNRVTMYRLLVYGLATIIAAGFVLSFLGRLPFTPFAMATSLTMLIATGYMTNLLFSTLWDIPANSESWLITVLILFLIIEPTSAFPSILFVGLGAGFAIATKYLVTWQGKHLLNPAAAGAALLSLAAIWPVNWWVGNSALFPLVLIIGLAVTRKIRRERLVFTFIVFSLVLQLVLAVVAGRPIAETMMNALTTSPLIFLATIMLTEPATMPSRSDMRQVFTVGVAILYVTAWKFGPLFVYPEIALLLGNLFAFAVSPKYRVRMRFAEATAFSPQVYDFAFVPDRPLAFEPGQYMDWTLGNMPADSRGNRRTFTIASSPTEGVVHLGVKFNNPSSSFKAALKSLRPGDSIYASQLSGDFTLPDDPDAKLAFIAGGIGVTPFRSMLKYIDDTNGRQDVVLIYLVSDTQDIAYPDVLRQASASGARIHVLTKTRLSADLMRTIIPDFAERIFYISGPQGLVTAAKDTLRGLGMQRNAIKTDYFFGY